VNVARKILVSRRDFCQSDGVSFDESVGFWNGNLPKENMFDLNPQKVAETINSVDTACTKFKIDLGQTRNRVGVFWFANLHVSSLAFLRLRFSSNSDMSSPSYEVNTTCWPQDTVAGTNTVWGDFSLNGVYSIEEYRDLGMKRFLIPSSPVLGRYIQVDIRDTTNPNGIQIGCFGASEVWESPNDFAPAPQITLIDESDVERVPSGSSYINRRMKRRRFNYGFPALDKDEVLSKTLGLFLVKGKSEPLVIISYPDDDNSLEKTSVYGLVTNDGIISNPFFGHYAQPVQVDEL
jgi:hypothetical protein